MMMQQLRFRVASAAAVTATGLRGAGCGAMTAKKQSQRMMRMMAARGSNSGMWTAAGKTAASSTPAKMGGARQSLTLLNRRNQQPTRTLSTTPTLPPTLLPPLLRTEELAKVPQWKEVKDRDAIQREFLFADFKEAFSFMTKTALKAEQMSHHPEWFNVYNRVEVVLSTHDCGGLSANDIELAQFMDDSFSK